VAVATVLLNQAVAFGESKDKGEIDEFLLISAKLATSFCGPNAIFGESGPEPESIYRVLCAMGTLQSHGAMGSRGGGAAAVKAALGGLKVEQPRSKEALLELKGKF
jgi:hypothetical protein